MSPDEQLTVSDAEAAVLDEVLAYFSGRQHLFESLASFVAQEIMGERYRRGWITQRSGDGGYDFVSHIVMGDAARGLTHAPAVILGQAKCVARTSSVSGG